MGTDNELFLHGYLEEMVCGVTDSDPGYNKSAITWIGSRPVKTLFDSGATRNVIGRVLLEDLQRSNPGAILARKTVEPFNVGSAEAGDGLKVSEWAIVAVTFRAQ